MLALDWAHLAAAAIWIGGLAGLLVLAAATESGRRVAVLAIVVPRFSRVAMGSVAVLLATGIIASIVHLPTLGALWQTDYGLALIAKSILLASRSCSAPSTPCARARGSSPPRSAATALGDGAARLLRRLVLGEAALLAGAVVAAAILTSIAPPSAALARAGKADAKVGPGVVARALHARGRAHPGRHPAQPRGDRQHLRPAPAAPGSRCAMPRSRPSSTCST